MSHNHLKQFILLSMLKTVVLLACLEDIKNWMGNHFLLLNQKKTEDMLFGPSHLLQNVRLSLGPLKTTSEKR